MSKQPSEIRSKFDSAYAKEQKAKYLEASEGYRSCIEEKKFFLAYVTLARLYLEKRAKPFDRECADKEYFEEASKLLHLASENKKLTKIDREFYRNKMSLSFKRLFEKGNFEEHTAGINFALARLEYLSQENLYKPNNLVYLFESAKEGYELALREIETNWHNIQKTNFAEEANILAHSEVSKLFAAISTTYNSKQLRFCLTVIKKFVELNIKPSSRDSTSIFSSPDKKAWLENINKFKRQLDASLLRDCYVLALENDLDLTTKFEGLNFLNTLSEVVTLPDHVVTDLQLLEKHEELEEEKVVALAIFYARSKHYQQAYDAFSHVSKEEITKPDVFKHYSDVLKALNKEEEISKSASSPENGSILSAKADELNTGYNLAKNSKTIPVEFTKSLEAAVKCANQGNNNYYELIKKLSSDENALPEVKQAYYFIEKARLDKLSDDSTEKRQKSLKARRSDVDGYANKARKQYDLYLREGRQEDIHFRIGLLRYQGVIFEKNYAAARQLFRIAVSKGIRQARYWYAKMCFYGQGGTVDIMQAIETIRESEELSADESYLLSEFCYLQYLEAKDTQQEAQAMIHLNKCIEYLLQTIQNEKGDAVHQKDAMLSLYMLFYFDKEGLAATPLDRLKNMPEFKRLGLSLDNIVKDLDKEKVESDQFEDAQQNLDLLNDPTKMLSLYSSCRKDEAVQLLIKYYKAQDKTIIHHLITKLCYESNRHKADSPQYKFLHAIIKGLDDKFTYYRPDNFTQYLENIEKEQGKYFDDEISDDSDDENETKYQEQPKQTTADFTITHNLIEPIEVLFKEKIESLLRAKEKIISKKYDANVKKIKSLFPEVVASSYKLITQAEVVEHDLQTINHYSAQGKLAEALPLVSTRFCVAQLRGLHFKTTLWNQPQRRRYRKLVKDPKRPLLDKPVYSAAVHDRAGVTQLFGHDELSDFRLRKIAKYIHYLMMKMAAEPPYQKGYSKYLPDSLFSSSFDCKGYQVQQLYSNEYDLFHRFIADEAISSKQDKKFVSKQNPMVSGGAIYSTHTNRYAYGNKPYAGHEHERLRPKYQQDGKCLRPYSGATLLTLHPVDDFARNDHHHVVSLNLNGKMLIEKMIVPEHECSFYSFIEADRLKYIHIAKFPSFNHAEYLKMFVHKYGITEQLYNLFKKLLARTKPHEARRRLATLLLGEYLCAYQTIFLMHHARTRAVKDKLVLIFRDKHGNFSLKPTTDFSLTPNGDQDHHRLRRVHTFLTRSIALDKADDEDNVAEDEPSDSAQNAKRHRTSSETAQAETINSPTLGSAVSVASFFKPPARTSSTLSDSATPTVAKRLLPEFNQEPEEIVAKKTRCENEESSSAPNSP